MMLFGGAKESPNERQSCKKGRFCLTISRHVPASLSILPLHFCLSRHCKNVGRQGSKKECIEEGWWYRCYFRFRQDRIRGLQRFWPEPTGCAWLGGVAPLRRQGASEREQRLWAVRKSGRTWSELTGFQP